jgi:hypothetical protein
MVGNVFFNSLQSNPDVLLEEITGPIFGQWWNNVKKMEYRNASSSSETGPLPDLVREYTQWQMVAAAAVKENLGDHPYPKLQYYDPQILQPETGKAFWDYFLAGTAVGIAFGDQMPKIFIHKAKLYWYLLPDSRRQSATLTDTVMTLNLKDTSNPDDTLTITETFTIIDRFYDL